MLYLSSVRRADCNCCMAHLVLFCLPVGLLLLLACSNSKGGKVVQAVNDGKCNGTYEGVFPAADCPGIYMMLVVNGSQYELFEKYIERSGVSGVLPGRIPEG